MRPDLRNKIGLFKVDFSANSSYFSVDFSIVLGLKRKKNSRWLKLAIQTKILLCVFPKFDENHHDRIGVVFTPEVRMRHVDRRWKAYPTRNKGESPEFEYGAAKY